MLALWSTAKTLSPSPLRRVPPLPHAHPPPNLDPFINQRKPQAAVAKRTPTISSQPPPEATPTARRRQKPPPRSPWDPARAGLLRGAREGKEEQEQQEEE